MELSEKVAYIKGLMKGLNLDEGKDEVKVLNAVLDVLDEMTLAISELQEENDELYDGLDAIDEDLSVLENFCDDLLDDEDIYDYEQCSDYEDNDYDDDSVLYEVTCPKCKEVIYLDEDMLVDGEIRCPSCSELLEFDMGEIEQNEDKEQK